MSLFEAWLIFSSPNVAEFIGVLCILTGAIGLGTALFSITELNGIDDPKDHKFIRYKSIGIKIVVISFIVGFLAVAYPTETQMYAIVGGHYGTNIEGVEELPENTIRYLNEKLTEELETE